MDEENPLAETENRQESDCWIPDQCKGSFKDQEEKNNQNHIKGNKDNQDYVKDKTKAQNTSFDTKMLEGIPINSTKTQTQLNYFKSYNENGNGCTNTFSHTECKEQNISEETGTVAVNSETQCKDHYSLERGVGAEYMTRKLSWLDTINDDSKSELKSNEEKSELTGTMECSEGQWKEGLLTNSLTNGDYVKDYQQSQSECSEKDAQLSGAGDWCEKEENERVDHQPSFLNFESPLMVLDCKREFSTFKNNFLRGCKWSPDGLCLLTASNDNKLRIFNLPTPLLQSNFPSETWFISEAEQYGRAAITVQERELVYDYTWYPAMRSDNPRSCCFAVTSRDQPVHLWDAWNGELICGYYSYDHLDQMVAANSTTFNLDGTLLVCGFNKCLRIFHTRRPGRIFDTLPTTKKGEAGQPGIISCMIFHPQLTSLLAAGSYLGSIGLYNTLSNKPVCFIYGMEGVTSLQFSADGIKLFSGMRNSDEILCHDMRNPHKLYCRYRRKVATHQRIYFDLDPQNRYLVTGNTDGHVSVWNLMDYDADQVVGSAPTLEPSSTFIAHKDCTNGVSLNPYYPVMATSSGQRHFPEVVSDSDTESDHEDLSQPLFRPSRSPQENTVKLWWLGR